MGMSEGPTVSFPTPMQQGEDCALPKPPLPKLTLQGSLGDEELSLGTFPPENQPRVPKSVGISGE